MWNNRSKSADTIRVCWTRDVFLGIWRTSWNEQLHGEFRRATAKSARLLKIPPWLPQKLQKVTTWTGLDDTADELFNSDFLPGLNDGYSCTKNPSKISWKNGPLTTNRLKAIYFVELLSELQLDLLKLSLFNGIFHNRRKMRASVCAGLSWSQIPDPKGRTCSSAKNGHKKFPTRELWCACVTCASYGKFSICFRLHEPKEICP